MRERNHPGIAKTQFTRSSRRRPQALDTSALNNDRDSARRFVGEGHHIGTTAIGRGIRNRHHIPVGHTNTSFDDRNSAEETLPNRRRGSRVVQRVFGLHPPGKIVTAVVHDSAGRVDVAAVPTEHTDSASGVNSTARRHGVSQPWVSTTRTPYHALMGSMASAAQPHGSDVVAVVPIKSFTAAKARLHTVLSPDDRRLLAERTARGVLRALTSIPTLVICDDDAVASLARSCDAEVRVTPTTGLNAVVREAMAFLHARGVQRAMVVHADLPAPHTLVSIAQRNGIVVVPDQRLDGTNVLMLPTDAADQVAYGPGSFSRHIRSLTTLARQRGLVCEVVRDHALGLDVDQPGDLTHPAAFSSDDRSLS